MLVILPFFINSSRLLRLNMTSLNKNKGKTSVLPSKNCFAILVGLPPHYEHFPIPQKRRLCKSTVSRSSVRKTDACITLFCKAPALMQSIIRSHQVYRLVLRLRSMQEQVSYPDPVLWSVPVLWLVQESVLLLPPW